MDTWLIVVLVLVVVTAVALFALFQYRKRQTANLRGQFGPEYERTIEEKGDRRGAERDLLARKEHRARLDIRPLDPSARREYQSSWTDTQAKFVDSPGQAIREADALIILVMRDRGYPVDDFEQRSADVSVDHPAVVENYRAAHAASTANERGEATTEDLRRAMVHYRQLFDELLDVPRGAEDAPGGVEGSEREVPSDRTVDLRESESRRTP
jgi:hypothetical protein